MTDRELLEAAAKAAGLTIDKSQFNGGGFGNTGFDLLGNAMLDCHNGTTWNPLTDDGDALRLAVKLKFVIDSGGITPRAAKTYVGGSEGYLSHELHGADPCAATRRAIVRAAAAIGAEVKP